MKINLERCGRGCWEPASDMDYERSKKIPIGTIAEMDVVVRGRNTGYHKKMFSFLHFAFDHYNSPNAFMDERAQFDAFRRDLIVLAGYYTGRSSIQGAPIIEPKSLAFDKMDEVEFKECASAMINAALSYVFPGTGVDENKLMGYF